MEAMAGSHGPDITGLDITGLIHAWSAGQPDALNRLVEATYPELHRIAQRYFQGERPSHTLQSTALIHEAYLRLVQAPPKDWKDRAHFFGFAARLMRGILVDYARARLTDKRGGGAPTLTLSETDASSPAPDVDILDLNAALEELEQLDSFQSRIVELRYFAGLSTAETAEVTGISESTVKREWILAKTWIRRRLLEGPEQK
jgi:RNA polymerase sigma factor (TIGR02999 family)